MKNKNYPQDFNNIVKSKITTYIDYQGRVSDEEIESVFELIIKRETLRGEKQYEEADKIRDQIAGLGISLIDHKNKTLWMKKEAIKSEKQ